MIIFVQSIIYILSIFGIFLLFFVFTDEDYKFAVNKSEKSAKIIDIYTYNIHDEDIKMIVSEIENSKKIEEMVDIVNIYERFDKKC